MMEWDKIKNWFDLTTRINEEQGIKAEAPDYNKDAHINALQSHIKELEVEIKKLRNEAKLNDATIHNNFLIIESRDDTIAEMRKNLNNLRAISKETNNYDNAMRGLNL